MVTTQTIFAPNKIADLISASAGAEYEIPEPIAPPPGATKEEKVQYEIEKAQYDREKAQYEGWTRLEVMVDKKTQNAARTGDDDKVEKVLDRLIGKPKTISEVRKMDYETWLKNQAEAERQERESIPTSFEPDAPDPLEGL